MKILALDIAQTMGWADSDGNSGFVKFGDRENRPFELYSWLMGFPGIMDEDRDGNAKIRIVAERVAGRHTNAIMSMSEMQGAVRVFCVEFFIDFSLRSPGEIKKHATGKGNAKKDAMVLAARLMWPDKDIMSHDVADALWLLDLELSQQVA